MPRGVYERKLKSIEERFWEKVVVGGLDDCWLWTGGVDKDGYGVLFSKKTQIKIHRLSWTLAYSNPGTLCVLHTCDNPPCVNPKHLWLGTQADNTRDKMEKGRHRSATGKQHGSKTCPETVQRGELHHHSSLTDDDIRLIRRDSRNQKVIARDYGVAQSVISNVKLYKTWKHVR